MSGTTVLSACPHDCPSTCALEVELLDRSTIGRVRGAADNTYTDGVICAKVARYAERVHHPDRLTTPLQRTGPKGSGEFRPISWDDALDEVANAFVKSADQLGAEAVWPYYYAGTMGLIQRDGINRLRHVMKYSQQYNTICTALADAGWEAGAGNFLGTDPREMAESDLIVMWGGNPATTQVNVMHHITRARKTRGAKLVVVDPYLTRTAKVADIHLALRPGTDGALACAVMHVLFRDGLTDTDYMARYTDCPDDLRQHLLSRDPAWASEITGLDVEEIEAFARLYGNTQRSYLRLGYGFTRSRNGAASMHAASCLPAVTGAWRHKGGGGLFSNRSIFGWDKTLIEGLDALDPSTRILDMSRIGPVLTGSKRDLGDGPPVTAMLVQNCNPAVVAPESILVNKGLRREDLFVCVHEQFMTDTAKLADIVLPATTFLEHDDLYQAGGQSHILIGPKVIDAVGESRDNHAVICGLAKRLGAEHAGFDMSAWELIDAALNGAGWPSADELKSTGWHDCMPDFETAHHLNGWATEDGKFHFRPNWASSTINGETRSAMPELPDHFEVIDAADERHPFRLVTAPAHNFLNSSFTETPTSTKREGGPVVRLNGEDAAALGVSAGSPVRVGNDQGSIPLDVTIADNGQQPGVVVIESVWPNTAFAEGLGVNVLTSAEPGYPVGGAVFHDTAVWVRPVT
jgi:anaerobic selenocysteine-containing dehydrogenase